MSQSDDLETTFHSQTSIDKPESDGTVTVEQQTPIQTLHSLLLLNRDASPALLISLTKSFNFNLVSNSELLTKFVIPITQDRLLLAVFFPLLQKLVNKLFDYHYLSKKPFSLPLTVLVELFQLNSLSFYSKFWVFKSLLNSKVSADFFPFDLLFKWVSNICTKNLLYLSQIYFFVNSLLKNREFFNSIDYKIKEFLFSITFYCSEHGLNRMIFHYNHVLSLNTVILILDDVIRSKRADLFSLFLIDFVGFCQSIFLDDLYSSDWSISELLLIVDKLFDCELLQPNFIFEFFYANLFFKAEIQNENYNSLLLLFQSFFSRSVSSFSHHHFNQVLNLIAVSHSSSITHKVFSISDQSTSNQLFNQILTLNNWPYSCALFGNIYSEINNYSTKVFSIIPPNISLFSLGISNFQEIDVIPLKSNTQVVCVYRLNSPSCLLKSIKNDCPKYFINCFDSDSISKVKQSFPEKFGSFSSTLFFYSSDFNLLNDDDVILDCCKITRVIYFAFNPFLSDFLLVIGSELSLVPVDLNCGVESIFQVLGLDPSSFSVSFNGKILSLDESFEAQGVVCGSCLQVFINE
ncbi:hypothetical protein RCL1_004154 [Eukaryota sp. TZLM3-RCL]